MTRTLTLARALDTERALTLFFLLVGLGMFALTYTFEFSSAALFPRLTAGAIVVGSLLLLFQRRLPEQLREVVAEPVSIAEPDSEYEPTADERATDEGGRPTTDSRDEPTTDEQHDRTTGASAHAMDADGESVSSAVDGDDGGAPATTRGIPDPIATFGLLLGYIALSLLIGILWATPLFALAYSWWFQQSRRVSALVFVTTLVIVFAFYLVFNAPLEDGFLLEWIW